jgi:hypothetical protein
MDQSSRPTPPTQLTLARFATLVFFAPTHYAGAFLLLPQALDWLTTAEACFEDA